MSKFELKGKVGDTEVWRGTHRGADITLTFYMLVQLRYHTWIAWLIAHNDGWDNISPHWPVAESDRKTLDQEIVELLREAIDDHSKDPHPAAFKVYAEGTSSEDARNRLISVLMRVGEAVAPLPIEEKEAKKKKKKGVAANA